MNSGGFYLFRNEFRMKKLFVFGQSVAGDNFTEQIKSNIAIIKKTLMDKELIDVKNGEIILSDPVFEIWLKRNCY